MHTHWAISKVVRRCGPILVISKLAFEIVREVFGPDLLTGTLLDRLTHHVNILVVNVASYRLTQSNKRQSVATSSDPNAQNH